MRKSLSDFLTVILPKGVNGGLTIAFNILLLKYLGHEQFGIFSLCIACILLADGTIGSTLDMGIMRLSGEHPQNTGDSKFTEAETAALILKILLTALISLILTIGAEPLGYIIFHQEKRGNIIWLTVFSASSLLLLRSLQIHYQLSGKFLHYGISDLTHSIFKFGGIGLILLGSTLQLEYVLAIFTLAPLTVALAGFLVLAPREFIQWNKHSAALVKLIQSIKWIALTYLITASVSRIDIFILSRFANFEEVGIFSGGLVFASIPELLGTYMAVILNPRVVPYSREGRFLPLFYRFQSVCLIGSLCIWIGAYFAMETLLASILPPSYMRSASIFLILLPGSLITMAIFPLVLPFLLFTRPRFFFAMDCISLPILLALYVFAIKQYGALGAAWVTAASKVIKGMLAQVVAWRLAVSSASIMAGNYSIP